MGEKGKQEVVDMVEEEVVVMEEEEEYSVQVDGFIAFFTIETQVQRDHGIWTLTNQ